MGSESIERYANGVVAHMKDTRLLKYEKFGDLVVSLGSVGIEDKKSMGKFRTISELSTSTDDCGSGREGVAEDGKKETEMFVTKGGNRESQGCTSVYINIRMLRNGANRG